MRILIILILLAIIAIAGYFNSDNLAWNALNLFLKKGVINSGISTKVENLYQQYCDVVLDKTIKNLKKNEEILKQNYDNLLNFTKTLQVNYTQSSNAAYIIPEKVAWIILGINFVVILLITLFYFLETKVMSSVVGKWLFPTFSNSTYEKKIGNIIGKYEDSIKKLQNFTDKEQKFALKNTTLSIDQLNFRIPNLTYTNPITFQNHLTKINHMIHIYMCTTLAKYQMIHLYFYGQTTINNHMFLLQTIIGACEAIQRDPLDDTIYEQYSKNVNKAIEINTCLYKLTERAKNLWSDYSSRIDIRDLNIKEVEGTQIDIKELIVEEEIMVLNSSII